MNIFVVSLSMNSCYESDLTLKAVNDSIIFVTLSSRMVSVKAGQGVEWAYLDLLEKSGCPHWEQTYIPVQKQ